VEPSLLQYLQYFGTERAAVEYSARCQSIANVGGARPLRQWSALETKHREAKVNQRTVTHGGTQTMRSAVTLNGSFSKGRALRLLMRMHSGRLWSNIRAISEIISVYFNIDCDFLCSQTPLLGAFPPS